MSDAAQIELIKALPSLILAVFLVGLVVWLRREIREKLLPRVSRIKLMWFEVTLIEQDIARSEQVAVTLPHANRLGRLLGIERWHGFNADAQERLVQRADRLAPVVVGASILWVDDRPQFNNAERNILSRFAISTDIVTTSDDALVLLQDPEMAADYDLIISDIDCPGEGAEQARLSFFNALRTYSYTNPLIFSVGTLRPGMPPGAFGICNRVGDLFHLIFDALERTRPLRAAHAPASAARASSV